MVMENNLNTLELQEAYDKGYKAGSSGSLLGCKNPYKIDTKEYKAWECGKIDGSKTIDWDNL